MKSDVAEKLKLIDSEISNALSTISQLEESLSDVKTDDTGMILKDECLTLRDKFSSFNESFNKLTEMLMDIGVIDEEDVEK